MELKIQLKLNIHKIKDDSLNLGHLVALKSNPFLLDECDKAPITLLLSEKSIPYVPLMCIVEVALDFTKQNQEIRKFKCKYFVPKKGIFEENWFYEIQLKSIEEKIKINKSVIEMNNKKLDAVTVPLQT